MPPQHRTVLLVDDEPAIRECLRRLLAPCGWHVIIAASPVEALEVLSQMRPDAVLLDVQMADPSGTMTSGLDLLTSVRARSGCADLPVLVLTGHFLTSGEEMAIQCLGATVIYKPVELHTLVDHLARCGAAQGAFVRADS